MNAAADARHYEKAAAYRDQVRALSRVQARQYVESNRGVDADVVACAIEGGIACVNLVMIRGGRTWATAASSRRMPRRNRGRGGGAFLEQHYLDQPLPALVVTSEPVELENANVVNPLTASAASGWKWRARTRSWRSASACATAPRRKGGCRRCARRWGCPRACAHRMLRHQPHDG